LKLPTVHGRDVSARDGGLGFGAVDAATLPDETMMNSVTPRHRRIISSLANGYSAPLRVHHVTQPAIRDKFDERLRPPPLDDLSLNASDRKLGHGHLQPRLIDAF